MGFTKKKKSRAIKNLAPTPKRFPSENASLAMLEQRVRQAAARDLSEALSAIGIPQGTKRKNRGRPKK
jgi:hypothetical protein